jgi:hypothetical protein
MPKNFESETMGRGVRERVGEGGRNDPNIVCTYELKKKKKKEAMGMGPRNLP